MSEIKSVDTMTSSDDPAHQQLIQTPSGHEEGAPLSSEDAQNTPSDLPVSENLSPIAPIPSGLVVKLPIPKKSQPRQAKGGVKRVAAQEISNVRTKSGRQVKRVLKFDDLDQSNPGPALSKPLKSCQTLLNEFLKKYTIYSWPFKKPVDYVMLGLEDYTSIVKTPMDLGTMKSKMNGREYKSHSEFAADMRLIFENCYLYYPADHDAVTLAKNLEYIFERSYKKIKDEFPEPTDSPSSDESSPSDSERKAFDEEVRNIQEQLTAIGERISSLIKTRRKQRRVKRRKTRLTRAPKVEETAAGDLPDTTT